MSSVSNLIKGGVNLITGNRSRPPSVNSTPKVETQEEYRERRRRNKENSSNINSVENIASVAGVTGLANAVNSIVSTPIYTSRPLENITKQEIVNEIVELTDTSSYNGQKVGNSHTPIFKMNNTIQTGASIHRPEPQQINTEQLQQLQQLQHLQQLQQLQNLQQYFNTQAQTPSALHLSIPQLIPQQSTPHVSTPTHIVLPSNVSNRSIKSNASNISNNTNNRNTENVLAAVSASLVYGDTSAAVANTNASQNITPATSKPASVRGENESLSLPSAHMLQNITIPDIGNIYESASVHENESNVNNNTDNNANNAENTDNVVINIIPLTHNNLSIHETAMSQQQQQELTQTLAAAPPLFPPLVFDALDPDGMM